MLQLSIPATDTDRPVAPRSDVGANRSLGRFDRNLCRPHARPGSARAGRRTAAGPTRRLAAIVVADVAGYTRMMDGDEGGTFTRLQAIRRDIVDPTTSVFGGRIVKSTGDGWLAEFASVTDALASSLDIQERVARRNADAGAGGSIDLRIGINLGEVIADRGDIYGTGVNVAARLESLAEPGGIAISTAVHEQVRTAPGLRFENRGEQAVKNLARPIGVFAVHRAAGTVPPAPADRGDDTLRMDEAASIAVLPFAPISREEGHEPLADGIVEDIITALSRFRSLRVVARNSTFAYKGRAVDVRQVARDLGVRYVLEGSVRVCGGRVRITGQLVDGATGVHVWADRYDGDLGSIFDLQDRITESVVGEMVPELRKAEIERARRKAPECLDAYDLFLRAMPHAYAMRAQDNDVALALLEASSELDPGFARALAFRAWCLEQRFTRRWPSARESDREDSVKLARAALAADRDDGTAIALAGFVLVMVARDYDAGLAALGRATALNPNNAFVAMLAGWARIFAGDVAEALASLERARALSPNDPTAFYVLTGIALAHVLSGRYDDAARMAAQSAALCDSWDATYCVLAVAHAKLGRLESAHAAVARLVALLPGATVPRFRATVPFRDADRALVFEQGLRSAGLPDDAETSDGDPIGSEPPEREGGSSCVQN